MCTARRVVVFVVLFFAAVILSATTARVCGEYSAAVSAGVNYCGEAHNTNCFYSVGEKKWLVKSARPSHPPPPVPPAFLKLVGAEGGAGSVVSTDRDEERKERGKQEGSNIAGAAGASGNEGGSAEGNPQTDGSTSTAPVAREGEGNKEDKTKPPTTNDAAAFDIIAPVRGALVFLFLFFLPLTVPLWCVAV